MPIKNAAQMMPLPDSLSRSYNVRKSICKPGYFRDRFVEGGRRMHRRAANTHYLIVVASTLEKFPSLPVRAPNNLQELSRESLYNFCL